MNHIFVCLIHYREVIAVNQDKLGKMGRRVVCIMFGLLYYLRLV